MPRALSRVLPFIVVPIFIGWFTFPSPDAKSLSTNVHSMYLHSAWMLIAIVALAVKVYLSP